MGASGYWKECIGIAADEIGLVLTDEQIDHLAESVRGGHENYGMAFYSPPSSDRLNVIQREADDKCRRLEREFEEYRNGAEKAIKRALNQYADTTVSITGEGEVYRHGGRTEKIL